MYIAYRLPTMNASRAAAASASPLEPALCATAIAAAGASWAAARAAGVSPLQAAVDVAAVAGVERAAEDRDAERRTELAGRVVDGRRDALLRARERTDDRVGRGRHRERGSAADDQQRDEQLPVARARVHRRDDDESDRADHEAGGTDDALSVALGERTRQPSTTASSPPRSAAARPPTSACRSRARAGGTAAR